MRLGNGRWETAKFNNRLQVIELGLGASATDQSLWKVAYDYGEIESNGTLNTAKNTGNIAKQTISFAGLAQPFVQTYKYDSLYRLSEAKEVNGTSTATNWIQNFNYDRFGNRTSFAQNVNNVQMNQTPAIDSGTNRLSSGQNVLYDKTGNIRADIDSGYTQTRDFIFDGENKQIEVKRNGLIICEKCFEVIFQANKKASLFRVMLFCLF